MAVALSLNRGVVLLFWIAILKGLLSDFRKVVSSGTMSPCCRRSDDAIEVLSRIETVTETRSPSRLADAAGSQGLTFKIYAFSGASALSTTCYSSICDQIGPSVFSVRHSCLDELKLSPHC